MGDLVPFIQYVLVALHNQIENATEQAIKSGLNYNLPYTNKLINFHVEYAHHKLNGSQNIITTSQHQFDEFRFGIRVNATRYLRF